MIRKNPLGSILLAFAGLAVACALLEAGAFGYLYIMNGTVPSKQALQSTLESANRGDAGEPLSAEDNSPSWMRDHVLHPYLGFVRNHDKQHHLFTNRIVHEPVNRFGFFGAPPVPENDDSKFVVGIFGGSVAGELYLYGADTLRERIAQMPMAGGREVEIISVALGGMKQPQQLLALNYLLATGHRFDVVVNLDGFNEIVLPFAENMPFGIATSFPRSWRAYATKRISPQAAQLAADNRECRENLAAQRAVFSGDLARESWFLLAVWQQLHKRGTNACSELESRLRAALRKKQRLGFQVRGPYTKSDQKNRVIDESAAIWERTSVQMWQICRENGIRYLHVLQPNQHVENSKPLTPYEKQYALSPPDAPYRIAAEHGYPLLREAGDSLKESGVPFFDLTQLFRDETGNIYKDACCHLNAHGNEILATRIVELIAATAGTQAAGR